MEDGHHANTRQIPKAGRGLSIGREKAKTGRSDEAYIAIALSGHIGRAIRPVAAFVADGASTDGK
jgi:hypothetical protein